jgi:hypothetical protein
VSQPNHAGHARSPERGRTITNAEAAATKAPAAPQSRHVAPRKAAAKNAPPRRRPRPNAKRAANPPRLCAKVDHSAVGRYMVKIIPVVRLEKYRGFDV